MGKKIIYSIFFSPDGDLPESVYHGLEVQAKNIKKEEQTEIIFITQKDKLNPATQKRLDSTGITIKDVSEYTDCTNGHVISELLKIAYETGNKCPFALASDILRMAVIELAEDNDLLFYADINDTKINFEQLNALTAEIFCADNKWGFAFPTLVIDVTGTKLPPLPGEEHNYVLNMRNDVLIAYKAQNPDFWEHVLDQYQSQSFTTAEAYKNNPPETAEAARKMAFKTVLPHDWSNLQCVYKEGIPIPTSMTYTPNPTSFEARTFTHPHDTFDSNYYVRVRNTASGQEWIPGNKRKDNGYDTIIYLGIPVAEFSMRQEALAREATKKALDAIRIPPPPGFRDEEEGPKTVVEHEKTIAINAAAAPSLVEGRS